MSSLTYDQWLERARKGKVPISVAHNILSDWGRERSKCLSKAFKIDQAGWFYKNCKTQRRKGAKICGECPFRSYIESTE